MKVFCDYYRVYIKTLDKKKLLLDSNLKGFLNLKNYRKPFKNFFTLKLHSSVERYVRLTSFFFIFFNCVVICAIQGEEVRLGTFNHLICSKLNETDVACLSPFSKREMWKHKENEMIINHNISAINAHRVLKFSQWEVDSSMAKLSSGMRINRAGDDPSGLAVSEKMRTQIQGLRQAERNTEDGLSFIQTAEGFMSQMAEVIQRIRLLAIQSSNGIYTAKDRQLIQVEVSQLVYEIDRIASQAEFNRFKMLNGDFAKNSKTASMWFHTGPNANQRDRVYISTMSSRALNLRGADGKIVSISSPSGSNDTIGRADKALDVLISSRSYLGAYQNRFMHAARSLMNAYENAQASESRIRDTDMAEEIVNLTTKQILSQTSVAMLAQAGVRANAVLHLLQ